MIDNKVICRLEKKNRLSKFYCNQKKNKNQRPKHKFSSPSLQTSLRCQTKLVPTISGCFSPSAHFCADGLKCAKKKNSILVH
jgi:hypothetical protein